MQKTKNSFHLVKLYFDCIDPQGNCFVFYVAKLKLYFFNIGYQGLIYSDENRINASSSVFGRFALPEVRENIEIEGKSLHIKGIWRRKDKGITQDLYLQNDQTMVFWNCHHPKAEAIIHYKNKKFEGLGYAETLELSLEPWKLPISELRWGRYLSPEHTVIWILWKGKIPKNQIFYNGSEYNDGIYTDDTIIFNNGIHQLIFEDRCIIRKGRLSGLFTRAPWLRAILPLRILKVMEYKYKSKSVLYESGKVLSQGWSLFEIVEF